MNRWLIVKSDKYSKSIYKETGGPNTESRETLMGSQITYPDITMCNRLRGDPALGHKDTLKTGSPDRCRAGGTYRISKVPSETSQHPSLSERETTKVRSVSRGDRSLYSLATPKGSFRIGQPTSHYCLSGFRIGSSGFFIYWFAIFIRLYY